MKQKESFQYCPGKSDGRPRGTGVGREKYEIDRFDERNEHFAGLWIRLGKIMSAYWRTGDFITGLQILTVLIGRNVLTVHQQLTALENFLAFVSYNSTLAWPIRSLGRILSI